MNLNTFWTTLSPSHSIDGIGPAFLAKNCFFYFKDLQCSQDCKATFFFNWRYQFTVCLCWYSFLIYFDLICFFFADFSFHQGGGAIWIHIAPPPWWSCWLDSSIDEPLCADLHRDKIMAPEKSFEDFAGNTWYLSSHLLGQGPPADVARGVSCHC